MRTLVIFATIVFSCFMHLPTPGAAQDAPPSDAASEPGKQKASDHFRRGVELYQEGAYRAAQVEFQRAYEIAPDYRLLYNIGQSQLQLHDYLGANQSYERYLADGGTRISEARRQEVESALEALRERVGRLSIQVNEAGAEVFVDDQRIGVSPLAGTVSVNVGRHRVFARNSRGGSAELAVDVAGGDLKDARLSIVTPDEPQITPVALTPVAPEEKPKLPKMRRVAIAAWGAAGAAVAGAVVTGVMAGGKTDDLDAALAQRPPQEEADAVKVQNLRDSAKTLALTTDLLGGTAILLAVAGTVLWIVGDDAPDEEPPELARRTQWKVGPGSVGVSVPF